MLQTVAIVAAESRRAAGGVAFTAAVPDLSAAEALRAQVIGPVSLAGDEGYAAQPWSVEGRLVNFLGAATSKEQVATAWPKETYDRLQAIKAEIDPTNLFRHGHALDPALTPPEGAAPTQ